jgi:hypothetical protein
MGPAEQSWEAAFLVTPGIPHCLSLLALGSGTFNPGVQQVPRTTLVPTWQFQTVHNPRRVNAVSRTNDLKTVGSNLLFAMFSFLQLISPLFQ